MGKRRGTAIQNVIVPIACLVGVAMAVVVAFVWFSARTQDRIALEQSVLTVQDAVDRALHQVGLVAKDYSWWNDSVLNLDLAFDPEWAHTNIGFYTYDVHGFELSFVVDRDDRTIYAQRDGERIDASAFDLLSGHLARLIREARAAPMSEPRAATGLLPLGEEIALVAVSAVTPEDESVGPLPEGPRVVLVYAKTMTQAFLDAIAEPLPLSGLYLTRAAVGDTDAVLPLIAPGGSTLASLVWEPHQPGRRFLTSVSPALAVAIAVLGAFTWVVLRHARQATRAIELREARFRDVADASSDWIWETDEQLSLTFLSERYATITGTAPAANVGRPLAELLHAGESGDRWERHLGDLIHRRPFRNVLALYEDAQGRTRTVRISGKPVVDEHGRCQGYRGTATDITAEIEAERRAQYLALHDPLTELPNRELLRERLEQAVASVGRRGDMAALLCLDLDRFKEINDTLGHGVGDALLRECALRLSASVRETDTVARIGGDEFAIVQMGFEQPAGAQQLCRRLLEALAVPFVIDGQEVLITASVGIALIPFDGSIPNKLLQQADIALDRAKEEGRGTFRFFEAEMDARLQQRKALERELRLAIARDELELYYQPKVGLERDGLSGAEALVRWNHPERGLVPPNDFIGVAEETGLIGALGAWVIRTACAEARAWADLQVSVNISAVQFRQGDLVDVVRDALAASGLPPERLELEITESVLIQHTDAALETLCALKQIGVSIAMDDFGTGYSSLSYLQRFPFDKIKIDRSFIRSLDARDEVDPIVHAVIVLGHSLGMSTCAEGVETAHQLELLRSEGCNEVQGYYFGKPMPVAAFEAMYGAWRRDGHMTPCDRTAAVAESVRPVEVPPVG